MRVFVDGPTKTEVKQGEVFSCENGHPMCEATRDTVIGGEDGWTAAFGNWRDMPGPADKSPWPACPHCSGRLSLNGWVGGSAEMVSLIEALADVVETGRVVIVDELPAPDLTKGSLH